MRLQPLGSVFSQLAFNSDMQEINLLIIVQQIWTIYEFKSGPFN